MGFRIPVLIVVGLLLGVLLLFILPLFFLIVDRIDGVGAFDGVLEAIAR